MGTVGGMFGLNGGANGTGFQGPSQASIQTPTTSQQAQDQYAQAQNAINQQQQFVNAVNAANGVGNQSAVFNQLQGVANGTGPNPAQAQLAQATGANVANQAALMAGQRGSAANVGLMARQAAQQGAANQQQAAGQAATLQANQSMNALNSMGSLATNQANQQANAVQGLNSAAQGEQGQILGGIASQNNANVSSQNSVNAGNAALANTSMGQQGSAIGGLFNGASSAIGSVFAQGGMVKAAGGFDGYAPIPAGTDPFAGTSAAANVINTPQPAAAPTATAATTQLNAAPQKNAVASFLNSPKQPASSSSAPQSSNQALYNGMNGIGQQIGSGLKSAANGISSLFSSNSSQPTAAGTQSLDTLAIPGGGATNDATPLPASNNDSLGVGVSPQTAANGGLIQEAVKLAPMIALAAAKGGQVPALVSPGEQYLPPKDAKAVAKGKKDPLKAGQRIPGKPMFPGNDYRNDVVPKKLESGGIVIPNEIMQGPNPHWAAHKFVASIMAKNGQMPKKAKK